jgi:hypothetical protein
MIIHFIIYNTKTGNFETNPKLSAQVSDREAVKFQWFLMVRNATMRYK